MNSDIALSGSMPNGNKSGMMISFQGVRAPVLDDRTTGALQGIYLGGPTSQDGAGTFGRNLQVGATQSLDEGSPSSQTPSLKLDNLGFWRFRWSVAAGSRSVSVNAKQTNSSQRPSVVVKSNTAVGLNSDISGAAAAGNDWVTIGPVSFTATDVGMVWVELHNNCQTSNCPAYFDHIVTT
jgi:hypothetical protein